MVFDDLSPKERMEKAREISLKSEPELKCKQCMGIDVYLVDAHFSGDEIHALWRCKNCKKGIYTKMQLEKINEVT